MQSTPLKKDSKQSSTTNKNTADNNDDSSWKKMINGIVRPPRAKYEENQLGIFFIIFRRQVFQLSWANICERGT